MTMWGKSGVGSTVALAMVLVVGCSTDAGDPPETSAGPTGSATTPATTQEPEQTAAPPAEPAEGVELPVGDAGEQARWLLRVLDPGADPATPQEVQERFAPPFLETVPAEQVQQVLTQLRADGPYRVTEVTPTDASDTGEHDEALRLVISGANVSWTLSLAVDADGMISGLLVQPHDDEAAPAVESWEELDDLLSTLVADQDGESITQVFHASVAEGSCTVQHGQGEDVSAPSGSVFKLVVLAVLVHQIEAGRLTWDQELTLTPEVISLPSGRLQDEEPGTRVSVREAADLMISISDNTATDLLIEAIGVEVIEQALPGFGISDELVPFLSTRQFFLINWGVPQARQEWPTASQQQRRDLLASLPEDLSGVNVLGMGFEGWFPGKADWYLSGAEICSVWAVLAQQMGTEAGAPVAQIVSSNPGLLVPEQVAFQGYKGGSSPGNLALAFFLQDAEDAPGQGQVVLVRVSQGRPVAEDEVIPLAQAAVDLAAVEQD